jgi:hypothetical protein
VERFLEQGFDPPPLLRCHVPEDIADGRFPATG